MHKIENVVNYDLNVKVTNKFHEVLITMELMVIAHTLEISYYRSLFLHNKSTQPYPNILPAKNVIFQLCESINK